MNKNETLTHYNDGTPITGPWLTDEMIASTYVFQPSLSRQDTFMGQPVRGTQSVNKSSSNKTAYGKFR